MLTLTLTATDANAARIVAAFDAERQRLPGETSRDMVRRCIKNWLTDKVLSNERHIAEEAVAADPDLTDVV